MANLVTPGYKRSTLINSILPPIEERIIEFKGLNRKAVTLEGEMRDMKNLTSDNYPLLTPRKPRGAMRLPVGVIKPIQLMAKFEKIAMVGLTAHGAAFYYDGDIIYEVEGLSEQTQMVGINTKICFFPEKTYIEVTADGLVEGSYGSLEVNLENLEDITITISADDTRFTLEPGHGIGYDDVIDMVGELTHGNETVECAVSCLVEDVVDDNTIILPQGTFLELIGEGVTEATFSGSITRTMPELNHVVEWNNRLWGCSNEDNTVYACKLGDPKNWQYFQGTGLDSYYAQQGTDGEWTGIGLHSNHLVCFKEDSLCKIYGTAPSNYQIVNAEAFGVEHGSRRSVVTINDTIFYKSKVGIMAYTGSVPVCISDNFNVAFKDVVAGTEKRKYYASIHKRSGGYELMVLDVDKGLWHKEDDTRFRGCATIGDKLYFIEYDDEPLLCSEELQCSDWLYIGNDVTSAHVGIINPLTPEENPTTMEWMAEFGPFDEYIEEHKIYSKLALRIISNDIEDGTLCNEDYKRIMNEDGEIFEVDKYLNIYISLDEGDWELVESYKPPLTQGEFIPIVPRRCDRYSIKVEGKGDYELKSLTRRVRKGTFGRL